jgi:hypothetical protein
LKALGERKQGYEATLFHVELLAGSSVESEQLRACLAARNG